MKGKLSDKARLEHIRDALGTIDSFVGGQDFDAFSSDTKTTYAVTKELKIAGQATYHVAGSVPQLDDTIDRGAIIALRHILVHEYYGIRHEILWRIITVHTADLELKIQALIDHLTEAQEND